MGCVASGEHVYLCVLYVCLCYMLGRGRESERTSAGRGRGAGGFNSREADGAEGRRLMQQRARERKKAREDLEQIG